MANMNNVLECVREEDFVEYFIFPAISTNDLKEQEYILNSLLKKIQKEIIDKYCKDYIWHRDDFKLVPRTRMTNLLAIEDENKEALPPHLYGISHYGENIEDEWFMVFLLQQITKENSGVIARVADSDGEFLLIETAEYLPQWADPEVCDNRVYLYEGLLHLVPPENFKEKKQIDIPSAISQIKNAPTSTLAGTDVQNCIKNKLGRYPDKITENLHCTTLFLPIGVAAILKEKPNLIAPAVQSFCNRDTVDMKACRAMKYFPPENRVYTRVKFTKLLYAMLTRSKFAPDRRTGWNLPPADNPRYKAHILGVKVACGFEILVSQAKPSQDIEQDKGWHNYLKSLKEKGYFCNLLENSRDYNNLLNKAKEFYINHRDSMQYAPSIGQEILELTKTLDYKADQLRKEESDLAKDDDESWLDISPEELDKMLQERYGQKKVLSVNKDTDAATFTEKITKFLDHVSDIDGAEFPKLTEGASPRRPPRGVRRKEKCKVQFSADTKMEADEVADTNKINFDPSSFSCAVQNILNFVIPDDNWGSESDMSEYDEDRDVNCDDIKNRMQQYMDQMDLELAETSIGQSFVKKNTDAATFDDVEDFEPVDIDMNALKNILESYRSQMGEAGPSSNMLGPMGVHLDADKPKNGDRK